MNRVSAQREVGDGQRSSLERELTSWLDSPAAYTCLAAAVDDSVAGSFRWSSRSSVATAGAAARFDLASLTKPFVATLALRLDRAGVLPLDLRIPELFPELAAGPARANALADLLVHRARLVPWLPLYSLCGEASELTDLLRDPSYWTARRGTYSDLGFILWGIAATRATGRNLGELLESAVLTPLEMTSTTFAPGPEPDVAECVIDTAKEVELAKGLGLDIPLLPRPGRGEPQDGNARFLGGVSGHAGLFATLDDLLRLGREWLAPGCLLSREQVRRALGERGRFALGWVRRTLSGSAGRGLPPSAFGHPGFVGGSLWIDPDADRLMALVGHRSAPLSDLNPRRRRFHVLAAEWAEAAARTDC